MISYIAATMPVQKLRIPKVLWVALVTHLRVRGERIAESGAFILGTETKGLREASRFVPYEALDPDSEHGGHLTMSPDGYAKLWKICEQGKLTVVADVHTHPMGSRQSSIDMRSPMIALPGHFALIVGNFAQGQIKARDIGVHIYLGGHKWDAYYGVSHSKYLEIR